MSDSSVVIVSAARTAIGSFGGVFKDVAAPALTAPLMKEVVNRAGVDPGLVDDILWGCCYQRTRDETNLARVAALKAGLPKEVPAYTIHRTCTSAMQAVASGAQAIKAGDASVILAGGTESMSSVPYTLDGLRWGARMGHVEVRDAMWDGLTQLGTGVGMGITAENLAERFGISREDQDHMAFASQQRAAAAIREGRFQEEILPFEIPQRKGEPKRIDTDEYPRPETSLESLAKMKPAFKPDGTVTAGNASGINDGSAGVLIMGESRAMELGVKPLARIVSYGVAGVDPDFMGYGPVPSTQKALAKARLTLEDIGLFEVNEAFAAQYLCVERELKLDYGITNVNGGAIALGHPVGCAGVRILVTLLYEMKKRGVALGLATLCSGGGMGMTLIVENIS
ncbi:MAG: acetyl-CoA C-acetyltransferase [Deltaproteobacteria bacterium]|nr:acetyl-CoA C-acetyltransferase [Deltaproteobacteria bacterium]